MCVKMRYDDFISLLALRRSLPAGRQVGSEPVPKAFGMRSSAQVLGSSEKQTAQALPSFLLIINELVQKWEEIKKCALVRNCAVHYPLAGAVYPSSTTLVSGSTPELLYG